MVAAGWRVRLKVSVKGVQPMSTPSPPHAALWFTSKAVIGMVGVSSRSYLAMNWFMITPSCWRWWIAVTTVA